MTLTFEVPIKNEIKYSIIPKEYLNIMMKCYIKCQNKTGIIAGLLKSISNNIIEIKTPKNIIKLNINENTFYCNNSLSNYQNIINIINQKKQFNIQYLKFIEKQEKFNQMKLKFDTLLHDSKIKFT